jgi:hypothetical protein
MVAPYQAEKNVQTSVSLERSSLDVENNPSGTASMLLCRYLGLRIALMCRCNWNTSWLSGYIKGHLMRDPVWCYTCWDC